MPALKVDNLTKTFPLKKPLFGPAPPGVRAVRPMSFQVADGEGGQRWMQDKTIIVVAWALLQPNKLTRLGKLLFDKVVIA